jgi:hypothetical protein
MKINDCLLKKITLLSFFISFLLLLYLDETHTLPLTPIEELSRADLNKQVKVQGILLKQERYEEHLFLTLRENNSLLEVALFYSEENLSIGKRYTLEGRVSLRKNKLQVIGTKLIP